jgi:hypothetical protein
VEAGAEPVRVLARHWPSCQVKVAIRADGSQAAVAAEAQEKHGGAFARCPVGHRDGPCGGPVPGQRRQSVLQDGDARPGHVPRVEPGGHRGWLVVPGVLGWR